MAFNSSPCTNPGSATLVAPCAILPSQPFAVGDLTEEIKACKRVGIDARAVSLKVASKAYRNALNLAFQSTHPEREPTGAGVYWSLWDWENDEEWMPRRQPHYAWPKEIFRISDQLHLYFLEMGVLLNRDWRSVEEAYGTLGNLTLEYIDWAEDCIVPAMRETNNEHVLVHLHEVLTTYCMTLIQFYDFISHFPNKMDTETRPATGDFSCHPLLGGLTVSEYVFEERDAKRALQKPRSPSKDTNRSGKDISFEELANIYRTSRVTLSNIFTRVLTDLREGMDQELIPKDERKHRFAATAAALPVRRSRQ